ncbi:MAG: hypothetical protein GC160_13080 [Acidobacteria bacterium]|nr:hypothetical protein [Acidobacteriota bacterium]
MPTKPADPSLDEGREPDAFRPFGLPRWAGVLLYALFWFALLIPLVRRWRRAKHWPVTRWAIALTGLGLAAWGWTAGPGWWVWPPAVGLLLAGLLLGPTADPDRERKLQRKHQAQYLLNGGVLVGGRLPNSEPLGDKQPLYLLIRGEHLLLVPRNGDGEAHSALTIRRIAAIEVDGARYLPIYVSEAKDPPVKETSVDRAATSELALSFDDGNVVRFRYQGAFHKHLAETAAHAVHSVRERLLRPQPAELTQILQ